MTIVSYMIILQTSFSFLKINFKGRVRSREGEKEMTCSASERP